MESQKPRVASYGLYVLDATGVALRAWLDYRAGKVCTVPCTLSVHSIIWAYGLPTVPQVVVDDLVTAVTRAGYCCFPVHPQEAIRRLEKRYDVQNPYPISEGPEAGQRCRKAIPGVRRRERAGDDRFFAGDR